MDIYSTETARLEPLQVEGTRRVPVRLNDDVISWRVSSDLYESPASALRELVANAVTSVEAAIARGILGREDALVEIEFGRDGELAISDNGIGISDEAYEEVFCVMGNSGNLDPTTPGMFGMGAFSYVKLSSTMFVHTVPEGGRGYSVVCRDARTFTRYEECERTGRGTTIRLQLYKDGDGPSDVELPDLFEMLHKICIATRVSIRVAADCARPVWMGEREITFKGEGIIQAARNALDREELGGTIHHIREDGLELAVISSERLVRADIDYLAGMPIDRTRTPRFVIANMLDERHYEPMPSRDTLTEKAERDLEEDTERLLMEHMPGIIGITCHSDFAGSDKKEMFLALHSGGYGKYLPETGYVNDLALAWEGHPRASLLELLEKGHDMVFLPEFSASDARRVAEAGRTAVWPSDPNGSEIAGRWGIETIEEMPKPEKRPASERAVVHYHVGNGYEYRTAPIGEIGERMTVVMAEKGGLGPLKEVIKSWIMDVGFTAHSADPWVVSRTVPYREWINGVLDREVETTRGPARVRDIAGSRFLIYHSLYRGTDFEEAHKAGMTLVRGGIEMPEALLAAREMGGSCSNAWEQDIAREICGVGMPLAALGPCREHLAKFDRHKRMILDKYASERSPDDVQDVARLAGALAGVPGIRKNGLAALEHYLDGLYELAFRDPERSTAVLNAVWRLVENDPADHRLDGIMAIHMARRGIVMRGSWKDGRYAFEASADGSIDLRPFTIYPGRWGVFEDVLLESSGRKVTARGAIRVSGKRPEDTAP